MGIVFVEITAVLVLSPSINLNNLAIISLPHYIQSWLGHLPGIVHRDWTVKHHALKKKF